MQETARKTLLRKPLNPPYLFPLTSYTRSTLSAANWITTMNRSSYCIFYLIRGSHPQAFPQLFRICVYLIVMPNIIPLPPSTVSTAEDLTVLLIFLPACLFPLSIVLDEISSPHHELVYQGTETRKKITPNQLLSTADCFPNSMGHSTKFMLKVLPVFFFGEKKYFQLSKHMLSPRNASALPSDLAASNQWRP